MRLTEQEIEELRKDVAFKRTVGIYEFGTLRLLDTIDALREENTRLQRQVDAQAKNIGSSLERIDQLNAELNDLTMAIVHLFSPDTAKRIQRLRAE